MQKKILHRAIGKFSVFHSKIPDKNQRSDNPNNIPHALASIVSNICIIIRIFNMILFHFSFTLPLLSNIFAKSML